MRGYSSGSVLERDLDQVSAHLTEYLDHGGCVDEIEALLEELPDDARGVVERRIGSKPFRRVWRSLERLEALSDINAPLIILRNEFEALESEVEVMRRSLLEE